jgi:hypothetical protein
MILFLAYYWFISLDIFGWDYFKVNYKIYLGFNHHFSTLMSIIKRASILSTIFLVFMLIYVLEAEYDIIIF